MARVNVGATKYSAGASVVRSLAICLANPSYLPLTPWAGAAAGPRVLWLGYGFSELCYGNSCGIMVLVCSSNLALYLFRWFPELESWSSARWPG